MTNVRLHMAAAVLVLTVAARLIAADISGTWKSTFDSDIGRQEYTYTFIVDGSKLTGTIRGDQVGESPVQNGRVDGDRISFVESGKFQGFPFKIYYSGTVKSNNEIAFTRTVVGQVGAVEEIVATRVR